MVWKNAHLYKPTFTILMLLDFKDPGSGETNLRKFVLHSSKIW